MDHPQGTTILVLGILSLPMLCVCFGGVLGIVAWVMGNSAIKEIDANPGAYTNRSTVQTGRILGIISTVLMILLIAFYVFTAVIGSTTTSTNGY